MCVCVCVCVRACVLAGIESVGVTCFILSNYKERSYFNLLCVLVCYCDSTLDRDLVNSSLDCRLIEEELSLSLLAL